MTRTRIRGPDAQRIVIKGVAVLPRCTAGCQPRRSLSLRFFPFSTPTHRCKGCSMKNFTLVQNAAAAITNIHTFNVAINSGHFPELVKIIPYVQSWYVVDEFEDCEFQFGPSKFIGYANMTAKTYATEYRRLDGRITEKKLDDWAQMAISGHSQPLALHTALNDFAAKFNVYPNKRARISLLS